MVTPYRDRKPLPASHRNRRYEAGEFSYPDEEAYREVGGGEALRYDRSPGKARPWVQEDGDHGDEGLGGDCGNTEVPTYLSGIQAEGGAQTACVEEGILMAMWQ